MARGNTSKKLISSVRKNLMSTTTLSAALCALAVTGGAAQAAQQAASEADLEEIVVTGSLVVRNGMQAPTPVTVLTVEEIEKFAPTNFIDYAAKIPTLQSSYKATVSGNNASDASGGANYLALRSLGANRTLVLLDGVRLTATSATGFSNTGGAVDTAVLPDALITRVDVVTGGATATYGSGALSGVVNLVLDRDFVGVKGLVQGGVTTYGDDEQYVLSLTGGTKFANDRGHVMVSVSNAYVSGVGTAQKARDWIAESWGQVTNPNYTASNGQPFYVIGPRAGSASFAPGGIITTGPLKGITFAPDGSPYRLDYGTLTDNIVTLGAANYQAASAQVVGGFNTDSGLDPHVNRKNLFGRVSYDVTDNVNLYFQYGWANTFTRSTGRAGQAAYTIQSGNPFIPASVQADMTTRNITSFPLGVYFTTLDQWYLVTNRKFMMYLAGAKTTFDAMDTEWTWDVFATRSISRISAKGENVFNKQNMINAIDAVAGPNGVPQCRALAANPTCVPYNPFGFGNASGGARAYVIGLDDYMSQRVWLDQVATTMKGAPFSTWAGPVAMAFGFEWNRNAARGIADPTSVAVGYNVANFSPVTGHFDTTEGFGEVLVPLAADVAWAKSLDVNGGVRWTDFSTSGDVTTYKIGGTYSPVEDIRFRATQSRDTRSPTLSESFVAVQFIGATAANNPWLGNIRANLNSLSRGNRTLGPEKADTTGVGVVYRPSWFDGFNLSVDYYKIKIKGSIASVSLQNTINNCFAGLTQYCDGVIRDSANNISAVYTQPQNSAGAGQTGIDTEASYRFELGDVIGGANGGVTLRGLLSKRLKGYAISADGLYTPNASPEWRYTASLGYDLDAFSASLTGRGMSSYRTNANFIECGMSGCPVSVAPYNTINNNTIQGQFYMDASFNYKMETGAGNYDVFFAITNLLNGHSPAMALTLGAGAEIAETLGRSFRAGVRFKM